jgi:hypothetical protein
MMAMLDLIDDGGELAAELFADGMRPVTAALR